MALRYGIDTSVLVRLLTGEPSGAFEHCVERLDALVVSGAEIFAEPSYRKSPCRGPAPLRRI